MLRYLTATIALCVITVGPAVLLAQDEQDEKEQKVAFSSLPQAVQATFRKEAGNQKIETVEKDVEDGKTVYEAEVTIDGDEYEIEVAEDGTLISKEIEDEEDDDDGEDDDGGDDD